jgi:hypothetical protein
MRSAGPEPSLILPRRSRLRGPDASDGESKGHGDDREIRVRPREGRGRARLRTALRSSQLPRRRRGDSRLARSLTPPGHMAPRGADPHSSRSSSVRLRSCSSSNETAWRSECRRLPSGDSSSGVGRHEKVSGPRRDATHRLPADMNTAEAPPSGPVWTYRTELRFKQPPTPCRGLCSRDLPPSRGDGVLSGRLIATSSWRRTPRHRRDSGAYRKG